jgi:hypothetical protein
VLLRQYLYFCTSKASKMSTCGNIWDFHSLVQVCLQLLAPLTDKFGRHGVEDLIRRERCEEVGVLAL